MNTVELLHLSFTLDDLSQLSEEECVFLFQMGGVLQEIITLQKYAYFLSGGSENKWECAAKNSEAMYFCRILAATLFEGWETFTCDRFRAVVARIKPDYDNVSKDAHQTLEKYFDNSNNTCEKVRNNYSYHYNYGKIRGILRQWPQHEKFDILLSKCHMNSRYLASDSVTNFSIFGRENPAEGADRFLNEIITIAKAFEDVAAACLSHVVMRVDGMTRDSSIVENAPNFRDIQINFFMADK